MGGDRIRRVPARASLAGALAGMCLVAVAGISPAAAARRDAGSMSGKAPIPAILTEVESSAEDIVDYALSGDRRSVLAESATLKSSASGPAAAVLSRFGVPSGDVALLKQRAARVARLAHRGSFTAIALAANGVSELMPGLYGRFRSAVPPLIFRLDYLDREVQLRSRARQPGRVAGAVRALRVTWSRVRAKVVGAGGATEARAYDAHLAALGRLGPRAGQGVQSEALRGLELVDQLERVFAR